MQTSSRNVVWGIISATPELLFAAVRFTGSHKAGLLFLRPSLFAVEEPQGRFRKSAELSPSRGLFVSFFGPSPGNCSSASNQPQFQEGSGDELKGYPLNLPFRENLLRRRLPCHFFLRAFSFFSRRGTSCGRPHGKLRTTGRKYNCRFVAFRLNVVQRGARVQELASSACISAPKEPR